MIDVRGKCIGTAGVCPWSDRDHHVFTFLAVDIFDPKQHSVFLETELRSFADRETGALFHARFARRLPVHIQRRAGQHSIRINDQWRLCFVWRDSGAERVEIVDYH